MNEQREKISEKIEGEWGNNQEKKRKKLQVNMTSDIHSTYYGVLGSTPPARPAAKIRKATFSAYSLVFVL